MLHKFVICSDLLFIQCVNIVTNRHAETKTMPEDWGKDFYLPRKRLEQQRVQSFAHGL